MYKKIERLFDNEQIEELLALTKNTKDPYLMFYYLAGLMQIGEYNIALSYITEHQMELYNFDAPQLIFGHVDILMELGELDQALNILKQYEDFPYFSLETNEMIATLGEKVQKRRKEKVEERQLDLKEIERRFFSHNHDLVLSALAYVEKYYDEAYIFILQKVLLNHPSESLKSYVLYILKSNNHDGIVQINKFGVITKVNPAKLFIPHNTTAQKAVFTEIKKISDLDDDVNFPMVISDLVKNHIFTIYPQNYEKKDVFLLGQIFNIFALMISGRPVLLPEYFDEKNLDINEFDTIFHKYHFDDFFEKADN